MQQITADDISRASHDDDYDTIIAEACSAHGFIRRVLIAVYALIDMPRQVLYLSRRQPASSTPRQIHDIAHPFTGFSKITINPQPSGDKESSSARMPGP